MVHLLGLKVGKGEMCSVDLLRLDSFEQHHHLLEEEEVMVDPVEQPFA